MKKTITIRLVQEDDCLDCNVEFDPQMSQEDLKKDMTELEPIYMVGGLCLSAIDDCMSMVEANRNTELMGETLC